MSALEDQLLWQPQAVATRGHLLKGKLVVASVVCLALVWVVVPALLLAQGDLNLEELADRSQALTDRVDALEALWIDSEPRVKADGSCINGSAGGFRDATVPNYKTAFDAWPDTGGMRVFAVNHDPESGIVGLQYEKISDDEFVAEFWQGCEFLASTDWWSGEWRDEQFRMP